MWSTVRAFLLVQGAARAARHMMRRGGSVCSDEDVVTGALSGDWGPFGAPTLVRDYRCLLLHSGGSAVDRGPCVSSTVTVNWEKNT